MPSTSAKTVPARVILAGTVFALAFQNAARYAESAKRNSAA